MCLIITFHIFNSYIRSLSVDCDHSPGKNSPYMQLKIISAKYVGNKTKVEIYLHLFWT